MQAPVSRRKGIVPEMPGAVLVESGEFREPGMPSSNDTPSYSNDPILAVSVSRGLLSLVLLIKP